MLPKRICKIQTLVKKMILLYMSTIFDNSLLIKAINDECRVFENAVKKKKNPVKDKEKNI